MNFEQQLSTSRKRHHGFITATASFLLIGLSLVTYLLQQHQALQKAANTAIASQPGTYSINHFIDGDTIAVNMNGHEESVRFIGVDTPETHKPNTPVECYGPEAAAHTKAAIQASGSRVRLVSDSDSTDRDRYGRLLRYVYLADGTDLDELNIEQGYGFYYPYFPFSRAGQFAADEHSAQLKHIGMWGKCSPTASDQGGYKMNELEPGYVQTD
jgi:micrococcal nuclease